ncbi:MAG: hypothetical protein CSA65_03715 [Proteobacteria bacterium]|nr:MAG: hypothetical protein CSB49_04545 [Pseudomonadota bacterium]PIE18922.1 MAG: hypothetical protein CSA65_03715 [Pseudomonadota bacterium]
MDTAKLDKLPAVFGRYVLVRRLSRGGMGEIFLGKVGEIQGFEKPIVIKKILPDLSRDEEFVQRFIEEAKIAINLSHANIVPVYEVGKVEDQYFLAMQYVEGRDLRTLLTRARDQGVRLPPELCLLMVREMANGLAYAHRRTDDDGSPLNLVHCDISPPNVLVSHEGEVKVIDFGIAKSTMQRAQKDERVGFGKFGYMAPEQLVRGGTIDRRTDIYACGVVLYELLTGQRLFNFPPNVDYRQVAREVTAGRFPRPSERDRRLGEDFDVLVLQALRTAPDERYGSAEALRDAVQAKLYTMTPTISADALASFVQQLFPGAVEQDRQMLRSLAETDLGAFRNAVDAGSSHTVSFALGAAYQTHHSILSRLDSPGALPLVKAPVLPPTAGRAAPAESKGESTRQLSSEERAAALGGNNTADPISAASMRWIVPVIAALVVVLTAIAVTLLVWPERSKTLGAHSANGRHSRRVDESTGGAKDARILRSAIQDSSPSKARADSMTFAPDPVYRADGGVARRDGVQRSAVRKKRRPWRRRRKPRKRVRKARNKKRSVSVASVQQKFKRVRSGYQRFERAYGGRLKGEWQRILFGVTYGKTDPAKLDKMLDGLQRKMSAISRGREGGAR